MTRKFDPNLGQYRDSGKFDGNDNAPAAGGMNALGGSAPQGKVDRDGATRWRTPAGKIHREDGPAVERPNGDKEYWINGKRHRTDGPAVEYADGRENYYIDNKLHRTDGPAVARPDGTKGYYVYGRLHREDGPAIERPDGRKDYYHNDLRHRTDGPAVEHADGTKEYWVGGRKMDVNDFLDEGMNAPNPSVVQRTEQDWITVEGEPVKLGSSTYQVRHQHLADGSSTTHLTGPRGAEYFLRGFLGDDDGQRQVISWKSGQPLHVKGNEVRVVQIGNIIEVIEHPKRRPRY